MRETLEQIVQKSATRPKAWARQADGRYTIFALPLSEPHNYDGDVFTKERQDAILANTQRDMPEGGVWVGHPGFGDTEAPVVGDMRNYRDSGTGLGRHVADWVNIEPPIFLDIALGRYRSYSIEYRLPNLDAYKGVALLGRSQAFFPFARVAVRLSDDQMKQLRQDADTWPKLSSTRSAKTTKHTNPEGNRAMKKQFRRVMKNGELVWECRAQKEDGTFEDWRNLREGEAVESDGEDMARVRSAVEELGGRMSNLESRMEKMEKSIGAGDDQGDGEGDDEGRETDADEKDKKDADRKTPAGAGVNRTIVDDKAARAIQKRLDDMETKSLRTRYDAKIDTLVAAGAVIDKATRTAILDAVLLAKDDAARDATFEALTKSVRKVALTDTDGNEDDLKGDDGLDLSVLDDADAKAVRTLMGRFGPKAKKAAREELKEYLALRKADPNAFGVSAGAANWLEANVNPGMHDAA